MSKTVTLVIHGTFARQAQWWRLGNDSHGTFSDRLEKELSDRGLPGTVWRPVFAAGFDYPSFSWSGLNRHRDRLQGARQLSSSLNDLAQRMHATEDAPLTVNFVAHSHGGNVVLEALRHLNGNLRVGRVSLLGTPLITVKPAFRIARFVFSMIVLAMLFVFLMLLLIHFGSLVFAGHVFQPEQPVERLGQVANDRVRSLSQLLFPLVIIGYGWIFWAFGNLLDVAWRLICRLGEPLAWLRGKTRSLVYGPSPRNLAMILKGRPILLVTSYNDEADLLLQVGCTPARLYREYVATRFSTLGRLLEFVFLRPLVQGVFLKALELILEIFALGFTAWRTLVQDFEVTSLSDPPYYPGHLLIQERLDVRPKAGTSAALEVGPTGGDDRIMIAAAPQHSLNVSLKEVTEELKRQIQLRHSTYYADDRVIARVADFLTGTEVRVSEIARPSKFSPSPEFWEGLLLANVGLAALYAWLIGPQTLFPPAMLATLVFLACYIFSFAGLGLGLVICLAIRRRLPRRLWRWFWILWAIFAFGVLGSALGLRFASI